MNNAIPEATINIPVNLYNPGQFFACCGLLELAHRLTRPGNRALGWFEGIDNSQPRFLIAAFDEGGPVTLEVIIGFLKKCEITTPDPASKEGPVILGEPFNIVLDWRKPFPQNNLIKTFGANQKLFEIVQALQRSIPATWGDALLSHCGPIDKSVTAFSIERAEDVIDAGFSMNTQVKRMFRHPPVFLEFLALIGTQRFCPRKGQSNYERRYFVWKNPLPSFLAMFAVSHPQFCIDTQPFVFKMYKRESTGKHKSFALSQKK